MTTTINNEHKKLNVPNSTDRGNVIRNVPHLRFPEFEGEWEKSTLDKVCVFHNGRAYKQNELLQSGKYRVLRVGNFFTNDSWYYSNLELEEEKIAVRGDLLYAWSASFGPRFWHEEKVIYHYHIWKVDSFQNVTKSYLYYYLEKDATKIKNEVQGGTMVHITKGDMEKRAITYPCIEEQKKIAKLLSILDERIATQNKIIDKLQSLIKGINQRVFMNSGINYKLGEICEIRNGYSGSQLLSKKGLKVSRIETISGHKVNMERVGYVAPFESSEKYRLRVGDILFSNINSVEYIGNTAFIDKDYDLYHGMNLLRLTPNNMVVIPFYLYLLLNTNRMLNHFKTVCNKAVSQASINQTELGKTVIQIPPIKTQKQICELYQALYTKLETASHTKSLFQNQKQYLLRQMFI